MSNRTQINLEGWQDYRGNPKGSILYVETSHHSLLPVRDQLNENNYGEYFDPNYETSTVGLKSTLSTKDINKTIKSKSRYLFFGTRYEGSDVLYKGKYLIIGYQRIDKIKDVRNLHLHNYVNSDQDRKSNVLNFDVCMAAWGQMRFVSFEDSFVLTDDILHKWGYSGKVARPLRIMFSEEHSKMLIEHFDSKQDQTDEYINIIREYEE